MCAQRFLICFAEPLSEAADHDDAIEPERGGKDRQYLRQRARRALDDRECPTIALERRRNEMLLVRDELRVDVRPRDQRGTKAIALGTSEASSQ